MGTDLPIGPLMMDLEGYVLTGHEKLMLAHPGVGGIILFSRNYQSIDQVSSLIREVRDIRGARFLIAVDQEGGRVQRFQSEFTRLPAAACFAEASLNDPTQLRTLTESAGWLMAVELCSVGVDFSFAPVLDVDFGVSTIIGDRSFAKLPERVAECASGFRKGMQQAGMSAVGKHFPGHGGVALDSHLALPIDDRNYEELMACDIQPFKAMIDQGLEAIMPAHVVYSSVDKMPAGFSEYWLKTVLRDQLGFEGVIFSDDLSMAGAEFAGTYTDRVRLALGAGCDMVLICNSPGSAESVLDVVAEYSTTERNKRLESMCAKVPKYSDPVGSKKWQDAVQHIKALIQ